MEPGTIRFAILTVLATIGLIMALTGLLSDDSDDGPYPPFTLVSYTAWDGMTNETIAECTDGWATAGIAYLLFIENDARTPKPGRTHLVPDTAVDCLDDQSTAPPETRID